MFFIALKRPSLSFRHQSQLIRYTVDTMREIKAAYEPSPDEDQNYI